MFDRRMLGESVLLVATAVVVALVANLVAKPSSRLAVVGNYPSALKVPPPPAAAGGAATTPAATPVTASPTATALGAGELKKRFPPHPEKPWAEIESDDAALLFASKVPFLDARRSDAFAEGHILGAHNISVWEAGKEEKVEALLAEGIDPEAPVVVYCSGGNCEDSHMLSETLIAKGVVNALVYKDGFPDWEKKGRPVEKGTHP